MWTATLLTLAGVGVAHAESCSQEVAKAAVEAAADIVQRLGIAATKERLDRKDGRFSRGAYSVKVMDHNGTSLIDPDEKSNVGRGLESFNDPAATNFMKSLIAAAIENRGKLKSYFTTDTERGVKVDKALYYVDVPGRKVVVFGAFITSR